LVADAPCWLLEEIGKWLRSFLWTGKEKALGGQCLVAWNNVCQPHCFRGLGIKDFKLQGLALRVRWEWLRRTDTNRTWQGLPMLIDTHAREVFDSLVKIQVGDGRGTLFWRDRWFKGRSVGDLAPAVVSLVKPRAANSRTVADALLNNRWIMDLSGVLSGHGAVQCIQLWAALRSFDRDPDAADIFSWPWSSSGCYSARSTYRVLSQGKVRAATNDCIWKSWASPNCKIFIWLALRYRI
jgi:hypothetical protein